MNTAAFSDDRSRRYKLVRTWGGNIFTRQPRYRRKPKILGWIMLNPSKASEEQDDPTIRKCIGFAKRWGFEGIVVVNLIPVVSTDPWGLPVWSGL